MTLALAVVTSDTHLLALRHKDFLGTAWLPNSGSIIHLGLKLPMVSSGFNIKRVTNSNILDNCSFKTAFLDSICDKVSCRIELLILKILSTVK